MEIRKLLYSMGEVSEMFDVNPSLIRYWETQFDVLKPKKNKKGNRLFTPEDVRTLKVIYHLVKERGMTLEGAKKSLKQNRGAADRDSELLERLQRIRSLLVEVREDLKAGAGELLVDDASESAPAEPASVAAEPVSEKRPRKKHRRTELPEPEFEVAAKSGDEDAFPIREAEPEFPAEPAESAKPAESSEPVEPAAERAPETVPESLFGVPAEAPAGEPRSEEPLREEPQLRPRRRRSRKEAAAQEKELFAFYEQSLFRNHED